MWLERNCNHKLYAMIFTYLITYLVNEIYLIIHLINSSWFMKEFHKSVKFTGMYLKIDNYVLFPN